MNNEQTFTVTLDYKQLHFVLRGVLTLRDEWFRVPSEDWKNIKEANLSIADEVVALLDHAQQVTYAPEWQDSLSEMVAH